MPHALKFFTLLVGALLFRLFPLRIPNVEPILAAQMPLARRFGALPAFFFGAASILLYDLATGTVGPWTLITASSYGLLGVLASAYFRKHSRLKHYALFGIFGAVLYDAATGLTVGPLFFNQPFLAALVGQIPFTLAHILGNVVFAVTLSPLLERWLVKNNCFYPVRSVIPVRFAGEARRAQAGIQTEISP